MGNETKRRRILITIIISFLTLAVICIGMTIFLLRSPSSSRQESREETERERETDSPEEEEEEETDTKEALREVLEGISYYGDRSQCVMTGEQAAAYAKLIADGMAGKVKAPEAPGCEAVLETVFWDKPYEVRNIWGDTYQTDRRNILLADLAGDGNPYLFVYSSLVVGSFEVYGWDGNAVGLVANWEGNDGRSRAYLLEDVDGKVKMFETGSSGADDTTVEIRSFADGTAEISYTLTLRGEGDSLHCIENGVDTVYPYNDADAAKEKMKKANPEWWGEDSLTAPEIWFYGEMQPNSLSEMLDGLNGYTAVFGYDAVLPQQGSGEAPEGQDTASGNTSPWLIEMDNCIIDVDLTACVPAERLEEIRQNAYGDVLKQAVSGFYKFPEAITITSAVFKPSYYDDVHDAMISDCIEYRVDNSEWSIPLYKGNDGKWRPGEYLNHTSGSEAASVCVIYDYGLPAGGDIGQLANSAYGIGDARTFYRTDYREGDAVMILRDVHGNKTEVPVS